MLLYPISFALAFLLSFLATPLIKTLAFKIGAIDHPGKRKIHLEVVPRLGGVAIYIGFLIALLFSLGFGWMTRMTIYLAPLLGIVLGASLILVLGIFDDIHPLSAPVKFFWQIAAALVAYAFGVEISFVTNPFNGLVSIPAYFALPLTVLWIVGITNAINLIDGLDGLAAGVTVISAGTFFFVTLITFSYGPALLMLVLAGAALGFLKYNFFPATIFLGDSGSLFMGFVLACGSITGVFKTTLVVALIIPLIILGVPVFDTLFAISRRIKDRQSIFQADQSHIHHLLMRAGFSQREAVMSIYIVCFLLSFTALVMALYR